MENKQYKSFFVTSFPMKELNNPDFWNGFVVAVLAWISSFIIPLIPFIAITLFLILSDWYTGRKAAIKRGEKIHSKGYRRSIEKFMLYCLTILASEGMVYVFFTDIPIPLREDPVTVPITYLTAVAIAGTEFKSNVENVEQVTGVNIWHKIKRAFNIFDK